MQSTTEAKIIQAFNTLDMFIIFDQANTNAEINTGDTYLERIFPAMSYVASTFHPTIGQCAPDLGMIPTRNKGTLAGSHIDKGISKFSQAKHSWVYQAAREVED